MASADPRLDALLRKLEPGIRKAFEEAIGKARRAVDIAALVEALERGDLQRAVDLLRIDDQVLYPLAESIRAAYIAGGQAVGTIIPAALEARFGFGTNPRAEEQVNRITGQLIQGIQLDSPTSSAQVAVVPSQKPSSDTSSPSTSFATSAPKASQTAAFWGDFGQKSAEKGRIEL